MGDSRSDERLPWLATPPAKAAAAPPAARRARTPLLILLALFIGGSIAVLAFLAGRSTAPGTGRDATAARASAPVTVRLPAPVPTAPVAPVVEAAKPQASPAPTMRAPAPRRAAATNRRPARRATRSDRRNMIPRITRVFPTSAVATAAPRRRANQAAPPAAPPRGSVVQLGAYLTMPQADAAWGRLVSAYPYLSTLPRSVTVTAPSPGRPLYYRLRVAAGSRAQARALCNHLHRIGRGCMVVAN